MARDDDDDVIVLCSTLLLWSAAVILETRRKTKHSVWMKQYLRGRAKYGVFNTLLPELATNDFQRWLHYLRMDFSVWSVEARIPQHRFMMNRINNIFITQYQQLPGVHFYC